MNKVELSGKIYNPKTATRPSGLTVWEASIGVSRKVRDEWKTEFFDLVATGKYAEEFSERITDKMPVSLVRGALKQEKWEQDGKKRQRVRVVVFEIEAKEAEKEPPPADDDIPF